MPPTGVTEVRLFVSSTFRDMQREREELIKRVFPEIRALCHKRGLIWSEVDLRWGIPDDGEGEANVLSSCLDEIDRCRPYFLCILGERYGWVPPQLPKDLLRSRPWLSKYEGRSVTELEVLHGALLKHARPAKAYFYLRDSAAHNGEPELFREIPSARDIEELGRKEAQRRCRARMARLRSLKSRIRRGPWSIRDGFRDPEEFGSLVAADLSALIDRIAPAAPLDVLDRERAGHESFVRSRARIYVGRRESMARLDAALANLKSPGTVVTGESGVGKSALLANWSLHYRDLHRGDLVVVHCSGALPESIDWAAMVRRILQELNRSFGLDEPVPDDPAALRIAFANALHRASVRGRAVLVLDGLDQLEDRDGARELVWLPETFPNNIRIVASTLPGPVLDVLRSRRWMEIAVKPLSGSERKQLLRLYLAQYGKRLSVRLENKILKHPLMALPLCIRTFLDELRFFGSHEQLSERVEYYLQAGTAVELYDLVLARYEEDYDRGRPDLVKDAMSSLWAARRGLTESELLLLLGTDSEPLPHVLWSRLHLAAEPSLLNRAGFLGFFHSYLRQAVEDRYVPLDEHKQMVHQQLARFFERDDSPRRYEEQPWQLSRAGAWPELHELLGQTGFFGELWRTGSLDAKRYWAQLESQSKFRKEETYRRAHDEVANDPAGAGAIATLFAETGAFEPALAVRQALVSYNRHTGDTKSLAAALGNEAAIRYQLGDMGPALSLYQEQDRLCREMHDETGLQMCLGNMALLLHDKGETEKALALHREEEDICMRLNDRRGLHTCLGNQGLICFDQGRYEEAMRLQTAKERICREVGDMAGLQLALGNQGLIREAWDELDEALGLHRQREKICRDLGDRVGVQQALGNQANVLKVRGDLGGALAIYQRVEASCRQMNDWYDLQITIGNEAQVYCELGQLEQALALNREKEALCRREGYKIGLHYALSGLASVFLRMGDLGPAMESLEEAAQLCREQVYPVGLRSCLADLAENAARQKDFERALAFRREEAAICRSLSDWRNLVACLAHQAEVLSFGLAEYRRALKCMQQAEQVARKQRLQEYAGPLARLRNRISDQAREKGARGVRRNICADYD